MVKYTDFKNFIIKNENKLIINLNKYNIQISELLDILNKNEFIYQLTYSNKLMAKFVYFLNIILKTMEKLIYLVMLFIKNKTK